MLLKFSSKRELLFPDISVCFFYQVNGVPLPYYTSLFALVAMDSNFWSPIFGVQFLVLLQGVIFSLSSPPRHSFPVILSLKIIIMCMLFLVKCFSFQIEKETWTPT